jgi:hypothetical protein
MSNRKVQLLTLDEILTSHTGGMPEYLSSSSSSLSSSQHALSRLTARLGSGRPRPSMSFHCRAEKGVASPKVRGNASAQPPPNPPAQHSECYQPCGLPFLLCSWPLLVSLQHNETRQGDTFLGWLARQGRPPAASGLALHVMVKVHDSGACVSESRREMVLRDNFDVGFLWVVCFGERKVPG